MNILSQLLGGSLGDIFQKIVGTFKASPDKVLEFQQAIAANQESITAAELSLQSKALDLEAQLNATAGANIQAEDKTGNAFTVMARPAVIWVGLAMFVWNWCLVPTAGIRWHIAQLPVPSDFMTIWGWVVGGYVFARTGEKVLGNTLGGAGGTVTLPFGLGKLDSAGDTLAPVVKK